MFNNDRNEKPVEPEKPIEPEKPVEEPEVPYDSGDSDDNDFSEPNKPIVIEPEKLQISIETYPSEQVIDDNDIPKDNRTLTTTDELTHYSIPPKTGDNNHIMFHFFWALISGIALIIVVYEKQDKHY